MSKLYPFVTHDKKLASALIAKGFKPKSCRYVSKGKHYFTFRGTEALHQAIEKYWDDQFPLNARTLLDTYEDCSSTPNNRRR